MEELPPVRALHEGLVNLIRDKHRAHRDRAVGDALGAGDHVGLYAKVVHREGRTQAPEAGDHLVEYQQEAVLGADLAQALEVALGRDQHARGTGHGLDDHRGDGGSVMQRDQPIEVFGKLHAVRRLPAGHEVASRIVRMAYVVHARDGRCAAS